MVRDVIRKKDKETLKFAQKENWLLVAGRSELLVVEVFKNSDQ